MNANDNTNEISVDDALGRLRGVIDGYGRTGFTSVVFGALKSAIVILKILLLNLIALFLLHFMGSGVMIIGLIALNAAIALKLGQNRIRKALRERKGLLLGTSFEHFTETYSNSEVGSGSVIRPSNRVVKVGENGKYSIDYQNEPNPHVLIVGSTSSGKTTTMLTFISRASLHAGTRILMIDWNGENETWAKATNATIWKVPENLKINLFKLNGMDKEARASMVEENLIVAARMTPLQAVKAKGTLLDFYSKGVEPSLPELWEALCSGEKKSHLLSYRLMAIQRVIGYEPAEFWSRVLEGNNVINLAGLNENEKALVTYSILQRICEFFDGGKVTGKQKFMVVLDEAWQALRSEKNSSLAHESTIEKIVRLGRKYGFGVVISTQQLDDLPQVFANSSALTMLHNYRDISIYAKNAFNLNPFEIAYLRSAAQGEALVFDRHLAQLGQWWPEYVKIAPLTGEEKIRLAGMNSEYAPEIIDETQQKISLGNAAMKVGKSVRSHGMPLPEGAPTPGEHAGLLGIYRNQGKDLGTIVSFIKKKGWLTSANSLYGYKGKPSVFDTLISRGMVKVANDCYALTETGMVWVDPNAIISVQSDKLGSEQHKQLLAKLIDQLHDNNMLTVSRKEKHSFDIVAYPVNARKKSLWDTNGAKGYEAQTSARKDSVNENIDKSERWKIPMVWVSDNEEVLSEIKSITGDKNEYVLI